MPGSVIAIALVIGFGRKPLVLTGTLAIMIIAVIIRRLPYTTRSATATLIQIPITIEEAAISLGASKMKTFFRVTVPMMSSGIVSGAILSWVSIVTEVSSAAILYNSKSVTLTVGTYAAVNRGNLGEAAAFAAVTTVLTTISLLIYLRVNRGKQLELYLWKTAECARWISRRTRSTKRALRQSFTSTAIWWSTVIRI